MCTKTMATCHRDITFINDTIQYTEYSQVKLKFESTRRVF